jgi:hypothetical protein
VTGVHEFGRVNAYSAVITTPIVPTTNAPMNQAMTVSVHNRPEQMAG